MLIEQAMWAYVHMCCSPVLMNVQPRCEEYTVDTGALLFLPLPAVGTEVHRQPSLGSEAPPFAPPTAFGDRPAVVGSGDSGAGVPLPSLARTWP